MEYIKFNERKNGNLLSSDFNNIYEPIFNDSFIFAWMISRKPPLKICESDGHYHIQLEAPGLKREDFKICLDRQILSISVDEKSEETENNKKYTPRAYVHDSFDQSFALPDSVDEGNIEAEYNAGVLKVSVEKKEEL